MVHQYSNYNKFHQVQVIKIAKIGTAACSLKIQEHIICFNSECVDITLSVLGHKHLKLKIKAQTSAFFYCSNTRTVFDRSDTGANIHFINQFCVASIRERQLFESGECSRSATIQ